MHIKSDLQQQVAFLVPVIGVEPIRDYLPRDFKSRASAYSATPASNTTRYNITLKRKAQVVFKKIKHTH